MTKTDLIARITAAVDMNELIAKLAEAADEGGTIQAADLVPLFPGQPTRHTAALLRTAVRWALEDNDFDCDTPVNCDGETALDIAIESLW